MKKCFLIDDDSVFNLISSKMILRTGIELETKTFVSAKEAVEEIRQIANEKKYNPFVFSWIYECQIWMVFLF